MTMWYYAEKKDGTGHILINSEQARQEVGYPISCVNYFGVAGFTNHVATSWDPRWILGDGYELQSIEPVVPGTYFVLLRRAATADDGKKIALGYAVLVQPEKRSVFGVDLAHEGYSLRRDWIRRKTESLNLDRGE